MTVAAPALSPDAVQMMNWLASASPAFKDAGTSPPARPCMALVACSATLA
jgi:hypothetical protein